MSYFTNLLNTSKLSATLLFRILLFSGIFTLSIASLQLYTDYQKRIKEVELNAAILIQQFSEPLTRAIWELNTPLVMAALDNINLADYFSEIKIRDDTQRIIYVDIWNDNTSSPVRTVPLTFDFLGKITHVGQVDYRVDSNKIKLQIFDSAIFIILSQFIKTFFVAVFILSMLNRLVIRHLADISNWLNGFNPQTSFSPLALETEKNIDNEMIKLKSAISEMGKNVHNHTIALEDIVKERTAELSKLAYTDSLTGIANRTAFFLKSEEELRRSRRLSYDVGVMMLDLDHFKSINDNYGHDAGDKVLKLIAETMNDIIREEDTVGRIGGEEFAVIVP
ncbi:diguanylate cyclase [Psychrosphaera algicola]|uniref:diguanylate cyclase n=1 Tax=Psychrosphaera algicola TaxID=3023714 RepID=A0ABT5FAK0_9GAMM|nr:sensor domain-containing diguanylate cyclase [Psychrosphaera sp. G1-22]MDC2888565.1 diguanylate cyclase [Psychrosphaera sp. G1-22]